MKKIVFAFGRYNPPTRGHSELILYTANLAKRTGADHRIYTSQSQDPSKNPLSARQKMAFLRQIFPGVNFVDDPSMKTAFAIAKKLSDEGYEDVTFVVGADRVSEFTTQLGKYVKPRTDKDFDPKKHYPFKKFQVVSSGARKKGISGTDLRNAVRKGDFATFAKASAARDKTLAKKIYSATKAQLNEEMTRKEFDSHLKRFIDFTCQKLDIKEVPSLKYKEPTDQGEQPSFAAYSPSGKEVIIMTKNRHPMDVFRSVAHELVHHKQNEDGKLGKDVAKEGATGSPIEDEANYMAGRVMRWFGKSNPDMFGKSYVIESKAIILGGVPGSGKDKVLKEAILPHGFREVSDNKFSIKECNGDNLVINGTMADYDNTKQIKTILESSGYKTIMVFVNTSNDVSRQRNEARASKGGRVINEIFRFAKWQDAQDNLNRFDKLFEKVVEIKNDLDVNKPIQVIQETYGKLIDAVSDEIQKFALTETDYRFEKMLNEVGGAGNWGTEQLRQKYQYDTPGEEDAKIRPMEVLDKFKNIPGQAKSMPALPIGADRIGQEVGYPKEPTFGDNQTLPFVSMTDPVGRWMVKEETRKRFKEKYGKLAEQKLRETAAKLRGESLEDPFSPTLGMTPNSWNAELNRPTGGQQIDAEKQGIFGQVLSKKIKKLNKNK